MGYRGKFITEHTSIELPKSFVDKYKDKYYIGDGLGTDYLNVSSKRELKCHQDIIFDLEDIVQEGGYSNVWALILWEDGRVDRMDLSTGYEDRLESKD